MYIGSSKDITKRWRSHKQELRRGAHHSPALQNSFNKYGEEGLKFHKLLVCAVENLIMYEQQYLDFYQPEYNISKTAGRPSGMTRSDGFKEKISKSLLGNKRSLGFTPSPETKEKLSKALLGNKRAKGSRGTVRSEDHKRNLSLAGMGHFVSDRTRYKIGQASRRYWLQRKEAEARKMKSDALTS